MADVPVPVQAMMAEIAAEFPGFKVLVKEDSRLMRAIGVFLKVVTLGGMRTFLTGFITTIGYTVYFPRGLLEAKDSFGALVVLRHERVHMRQRRKYGMLLFSLLYLLLPIPGGLSYFRMRFEREAYVETIRATAELSFKPETAQGHAFRSAIVSYFTGPSYFFMWPFRRSVEAWFDETAASAVASVRSRTP